MARRLSIVRDAALCLVWIMTSPRRIPHLLKISTLVEFCQSADALLIDRPEDDVIRRWVEGLQRVCDKAGVAVDALIEMEATD